MQRIPVERFGWGQSPHSQVWIIDFDSKTTPIIEQKFRKANVGSRILFPAQKILFRA
ncbi:MAG: hypothetical protein HY006_02080 [Candidatus Sungbacteria bacterium]|nr:hypothetical protein [Candidatus Sungbacteria bacterium]